MCIFSFLGHGSFKTANGRDFCDTVALKCQTQLVLFTGLHCFSNRKSLLNPTFQKRQELLLVIGQNPNLFQRLEVISCLLPVSGSKRQLCFLSCCCFCEVALYYAALQIHCRTTLDFNCSQGSNCVPASISNIGEDGFVFSYAAEGA